MWDENFPGTLSWNTFLGACRLWLEVVSTKLKAVVSSEPSLAMQGLAGWSKPVVHWPRSSLRGITSSKQESQEAAWFLSREKTMPVWRDLFIWTCLFQPLQLLWPTDNADAQERWAPSAGRPCQSAWCCQLTPFAGNGQYSAFPCFLILFWPFYSFLSFLIRSQKYTFDWTDSRYGEYLTQFLTNTILF